MFNNQKGFTLIELMVVVVIIGILAAIALPNFLSMQDRAKEAEVKANAHTTQLTVEDFKTKNNGAKPTAFTTAAPSETSTTALLPASIKNPFYPALSGTAAIFRTNAATATAWTAGTGGAAGNPGTTEYAWDGTIAPYIITGYGKTATAGAAGKVSTLNEGL